MVPVPDQKGGQVARVIMVEKVAWGPDVESILVQTPEFYVTTPPLYRVITTLSGVV